MGNGIINDNVLILLGEGAFLQSDMQSQIRNLGRGIASTVQASAQLLKGGRRDKERKDSRDK